MKAALLFVSALFCASQALAYIDISNGKVTINVSGGDATSWGGNGSSAGAADITLSYADAAKTVVLITGTTTRFGKTRTISEQIALKDLKSITIYAVGGSGANGYWGSSGSSGRDGSDGRDGSNGHDGCPPGSGGRGSDGSDGTDGRDGGDGGPGGHGGRGGVINVNTAPDQSELMLFVRTATGGGSGGNGGAGGSGGSGGRGGRGGDGGRGGRNTCKDEKGNPKWGPDGSSGWRGSDGRSGDRGRNGSPGRSGGGGRNGSRSFNLVSGGGKQSFASVFDLDVANAKFVDDNGDEILEPGERAYLSSLQVINKGPMPSPAAQTIRISVLPSSTALTPAALSVPLDPVAANTLATLTPKKGAITLQVPNATSLIGKKVATTVRLSINNVSLDTNLDTGMAIRWPVTLNAPSLKTAAAFEIPKVINYSLKNVSSQELGPRGSKPLSVRIGWSSKAVPASDVSVTLADGRVLNLAEPVLLGDLTVPAKGTLEVPLSLLVRDSKLLTAGAGTLAVSLRLQDLSRPNEVVLQSLENAVALKLDLKALSWTQELNLAHTRIQCQFPNLPHPAQPIATVQINKAAGRDRLQVQLTVPGSSSARTSPVIAAPINKMMPAYVQLQGEWVPQNVVDFLNQIVAPSSPKGPWTFKSCSVAPN